MIALTLVSLPALVDQLFVSEQLKLFQAFWKDSLIWILLMRILCIEINSVTLN